MHAVSLTPHAQKKFRTTSKSENHKQNSDGMKKIKMHAVSMTPHAKYDTACTIDGRFERHRMHDICVRKSIISRRIRSRIQKDFSP
jgi:hypothetical protein